MTTRNLCLALLVTAVIPASSSVAGEQVFGVADSVVCSPEHSAEHHNLFINTQNSWFHNPALHFDEYGSTYGNLGIYADKRREDEAFVMQGRKCSVQHWHKGGELPKTLWQRQCRRTVAPFDDGGMGRGILSEWSS